MAKVPKEQFGASMLAAAALAAPDRSDEYLARYKSRQVYIALLSELMDKFDLDAFVLPFTIAPAPELEGSRPPGERRRGGYGEGPGVNNLTSTLGLPAVVVPGGYTPSKNFPIAIQFFGKPFTDLKILQVAHAYEQATHQRKAPESTPALPGERFDYGPAPAGQ